MHTVELTMSEMLRDPMVRLMLRADRVPLRDFARLLEEAAEARNANRPLNDLAARPRSH